MTFILFQGHRYVRIINCKLIFRFLSTVVKSCMVARHIKKIKHSMLCLTVVCLRDIINTLLVVVFFSSQVYT